MKPTCLSVSSFSTIALLILLAGCSSHTAHAGHDPSQDASAWNASGRRGAVAAGTRAASDAGLETLRAGGNAVDAAVACLLTLSVTDSNNFCFGGEVPILIYDAHRKVVEVIAGQGTAPRLATLEYFQSKGGIPSSGLEPAAVPAALDACLTALDRSGTMTFAQVARPMQQALAAGKQPWHADLARTIQRLIEAERQSPNDRRRGLRLVADCFYRGPIAHEIDAWCREHGGLIRYADLATHTTRVEDPVSVDYRGHTVYKCGPWTQGPFMLQTLRLLEGFDLKSLGHNSPDYIHTTVEAMKLALADRDVYYADPLFADVPLDPLLSADYASVRRPLISPDRASLTLQPGDPGKNLPSLDRHTASAGTAAATRDTTTCLTADRWGNVVAATPSGWGGVVAGPTGVWLGTRLQSFNTVKGSPNQIEPGKRPRITLTPTLVMKDGKPVLAISVAGGDLQDQVSIQLLLNALDFGMTPGQSVTAPRFSTAHHINSFRQTPPILGNLTLYKDVGPDTLSALAARGHHLSPVQGPLGHPCVLAINPMTGTIRAAGDPQAHRHAAAY